MHGSLPILLAGVGLCVWIGFWTWIGRRPLRKSRNRPTWQTRAGQAGESKTTQILRRHGLTVWPDVRIAIGHRTSQCDQIVVGAFGLVVLETKHWTGELARHGDQWRQRRADGSVHQYASPESQNAYHVQVVRQALKAHGLGRISVYGGIVLSHPHAEFVDGPGTQPIGSPEQMARWIQRLPASRPFNAHQVERILRSSGAGVARATPWG